MVDFRYGLIIDILKVSKTGNRALACIIGSDHLLLRVVPSGR